MIISFLPKKKNYDDNNNKLITKSGRTWQWVQCNAIVNKTLSIIVGSVLFGTWFQGGKHVHGFITVSYETRISMVRWFAYHKDHVVFSHW
jgi:hypothetical protein